MLKNFPAGTIIDVVHHHKNRTQRHRAVVIGYEDHQYQILMVTNNPRGVQRLCKISPNSLMAQAMGSKNGGNLVREKVRSHHTKYISGPTESVIRFIDKHGKS